MKNNAKVERMGLWALWNPGSNFQADSKTQARTQAKKDVGKFLSHSSWNWFSISVTKWQCRIGASLVAQLGLSLSLLTNWLPTLEVACHDSSSITCSGDHLW